MRLKIAAATAALCLMRITSADGQGGPPPTAEPSAYCRSGAAAIFSGASDAEIAQVMQKCRRGDTIAIRPGSQGGIFAIGRLCDFTKAIANAGDQVVCIIGPARGVR